MNKKRKKVIIAFDGTIRAGKTTIVRDLSTIFGGKHINEYKYYAEKLNKKFPEFPFINLEDALNATRFFIFLEKKRYSDIKKYKSGIIFVDRTFHSCIGFDYASSKYLDIDIFKNSNEIWNKNNKKIIPDIIFFMNVSHKKMVERITINKDKFPKHIKDKKFNLSLKKYFKSLINKNFIEINASKNKKNVRAEVENYIKSILKSKKV